MRRFYVGSWTKGVVGNPPLASIDFILTIYLKVFPVFLVAILWTTNWRVNSISINNFLKVQATFYYQKFKTHHSFLSGMLCLPLREALRRETTQTETQRDCHRDPSQLRAPAGAFPAPEDSARVASHRGVCGDARLRLGAGLCQSRQYPRLPGVGCFPRWCSGHRSFAAVFGATASAC